MPLIGHVMLLIWPVVGLMLFTQFRVPIALSVTLIAGYLFLPPKLFFDLPAIPNLNKENIPVLTAFLILALGAGNFRKEALLPGWLPRHWLFQLLIAMLVIGAIGTVVTNRGVLVYGPRVITGLGFSDIRVDLFVILFTLLPFLMARKYLSDETGQRALLVIVLAFAVFYTLPALYEVRMSPRLNFKLYGEFPHSWMQHLRGGSWRPIVFLDHGLKLGLFLSMATLLAFGYIKAVNTSDRAKYILAGAWLFVVLVLSKNLGALLLAIMFVPIALIFSARMQVIFAAVIAGVILCYPILRSTGVISAPAIMSVAENVNPTRARSLAYRLEHEDILMAKASQKPIWGWGGWGRSRVYETQYGDDISTTDGLWVITFGVRGWVGYLSYFGLLCMPIILLAAHRSKPISPTTALVALLLALNLIDLVPNTGVTTLTWLLAGSLLGTFELRRKGGGGGETAPVETTDIMPRRTPNSYSRFPRETQPLDR